LGPNSKTQSHLEISLQKAVDLAKSGRHSEALSLGTEILRIAQRDFGPDSAEVAVIFNNLAAFHKQCQNYVAAENLYLQSQAIREKIFGPDHLSVAKVLNNLAALYHTMGNYHNAESLCRKALKIAERTCTSVDENVIGIVSNLAAIYDSLGRYAKARGLYSRALLGREKSLSTTDPRLIRSTRNLADICLSLGDFKKAERLYKKALRSTGNAFGSNHEEVARSIDDLAALYEHLGEYGKAKPLYEKALKITQEALGHDHPKVARILENIARLYTSLRLYSKIEPLYKRSLEITERALGPDHKDVAECLNNLAFARKTAGDYSEAVHLHERALEITGAHFGPEHPKVASDISQLAVVYMELGHYDKAESLHIKALEINENALGPSHPLVASSLHHLAALYMEIGNHDRAESLYMRALDIRKSSFGPNHPYLAASLNNMAGLYKELGDYTRAESMHIRALRIQERALGSNHPDVATSLNNLGLVYMALGKYNRAKLVLRRSLKITEKTFGGEHPDFATSLNNLGLAYIGLRDYAKARPLYQRAIEIRKRRLGSGHPDVSQSLNNLAYLYCALGEYAKAESLYKRSLRIMRASFGEVHLNTSKALQNLGLLLLTVGDYRKANRHLAQAQAINAKIISHVMGFTSENRKLLFLKKMARELHAYLWCNQMYLGHDPACRKAAFDTWLSRKGIALEFQKRFQEVLVLADEPEMLVTFQELSSVRTQLSRLVYGGFGKLRSKDVKKRIRALEEEKMRLEAKLSRGSRAFAVHRLVARANAEMAAKALPRRSVLVEFAKLETINLWARNKVERLIPSRYLVFILHGRKADQIEIIDIGDAKKIDEAVSRFRTEIRKVHDIQGKEVSKFCQRLYEMVFQPIESAVGDAKDLFISTDGNLSLIPFEVLQRPGGKYLIEDAYAFNYLVTGRDIIGFGKAREKPGKAVLMGDPDFDLRNEAKEFVLRSLSAEEKLRHEKTLRSSDMRSLEFEKLKYAREELETIHGILGHDNAEIYLGKSALEEILRCKNNPRILHLATHGFFLHDLELDDVAYSSVGGMMTMGFEDSAVHKRSPGRKFKIENPLLRSGFALAGANSTLDITDSTEADGIVTAEKILGLRLRGTELVVVSACDTGLGKVETGEGVFGLRRAFTQAGAKSLVMSLWRMPDEGTKDIMIAFHRNIASGVNKCRALKEAALEQMGKVKKMYGVSQAHPALWGGFIFMGEP